MAILAGLAGSADAAGRRSSRTSDADRREAAARSGFSEHAKGTLQMVVSLSNQRVTLYSNGVLIAQAPISSGTRDRPTPTGVFSVIQKDRWHRSNLYDNAPMFYMQRLTWSGVAMHEGMLPGVPASHGCIRLPREFAARLWGVTRLGVRIVVAHEDVVPQDFSHPALFAPKPKTDREADPKTDAKPDPEPETLPEAKPSDMIAFTGRLVGLRPTITIDRVPPAIDVKAPPVTLVETPLFAIEPAKPALDVVAPVKPIPSKPMPSKPVPSKPVPSKPAAEPPKRGGQVAVFVSRKEKKIFVRQGFVPLFDLPVEIADPDRPLGTHVFTAIELQDNGAGMRWNVMSMPGDTYTVERGEGRRASTRNREPAPRSAAEAGPPPPAAQALGRIQMPQEAIDRIGEILIPGSSLVISDQGLGRETGRATEFIVLTR